MPMTAGDLMIELAKYPRSMKIVIDVNLEQCHSDRNVFDILEVTVQPVGFKESGDEDWLFIQAEGNGVGVKEGVSSISDLDEYTEVDEDPE